MFEKLKYLKSQLPVSKIVKFVSSPGFITGFKIFAATVAIVHAIDNFNEKKQVKKEKENF